MLTTEFDAVKDKVQFLPPFMSGRRQLPPFSQNEEIGIYFKEFIQTKEGLTAAFEAVNRSNKIAYYYAYPTDARGLIETEAFYQIDGVEQNNFFCGDALKTFRLQPGESVVFDVYAENLKYYFRDEGNNRIGFDFSVGKKKNYKLYWSENLYLPPEIKTHLSIEAGEREKLKK
ncbi:MAG TPA: hypothetical protein VF599_14805 [Pyrinomonadaceae bacterium]